MKKQNILLILLAIALPFLFAASGGVAEVQGKDRTGAPGSDQACNACHSGGDFGTVTTIEVLQDGSVVTDYLAGETYTIRFLVEGENQTALGHGFQGTAVYEDGSNAGTFINPGTNVQLEEVDGRHIVEHSATDEGGIFLVDWQAPETLDGDVTFYASGNAVDLSSTFGGDEYAPGTLVLGQIVLSVEDEVKKDRLIYQNGSEVFVDGMDGEILYLFSLTGKMITKSRLNGELNSIPVGNLESGVYVFSIQGEEGIITQKVFIQ